MGTLILTPSSIIIMELILNMLSFDFIFLLRLTDEEIAERAPLIFVPYFVPHFFNFQVCSASLLLSGFDAGPSLEFAVSAHRRTLLTNTSSLFPRRISTTSLPSPFGLLPHPCPLSYILFYWGRLFQS
jgi:hypothetical protein